MNLDNTMAPGTVGDSEVVPLRIERGAEVIGTDGPLGTVAQVVMNARTGQLQDIVVRPERSAQEIAIPVGHIARASGAQLYLDFSRADMAANPGLVQPYNPGQYVAVAPEATVAPAKAAQVASATEQPVVTNLEQDAVEVLAPPSFETATQAAPLASQPASSGSIPASPSNPSSSSQEKTPVKDTAKTSDQSLRTPQARSAQQEAQQVAPNPESAAYLTDNAMPMQNHLPAPAPLWRSPVVIGAASAAVLVGGAAVALWYGRRPQPSTTDKALASINQMADALSTSSKHVSKNLAKSAKAYAPVLESWRGTTADQLDTWRELLGDQLDAWRGDVGKQLQQNAKQLQQNAKLMSRKTSNDTSKALAASAASLATLGMLASRQLDGWRGLLGDQLDAWRSILGTSLTSGSKTLSRGMEQSAKALANGRNNLTRTPRRMVKQTKIGARWFRRGIFFGGLGGAGLALLFAPVSGQQARAQLGSWIAQGRAWAQNMMGDMRGQSAATPTGTETTPTGAPAAR
jgi:gas vesicle protein